jgi:N-acyl-L-homoserine lactone synthetase
MDNLDQIGVSAGMPGADALDDLDRMAVRLRAAAPPVVFRPASTAAERHAVYRLRARAVIERGWLPASALPDAIETDAFDRGATLIGGWAGDDLAAAARLVWPDAPAGSPVRAEYGLTLEPAAEIVHLDRICVARQLGDASGRLTIALIGAAWLAIRERGFRRFSGIDSPAVTRLYRRLGFNLTVISEPRWYWGEERYPILFDPLGRDRVNERRLAARTQPRGIEREGTAPE